MSQHSLKVDESGQALLARHAGWWKRQTNLLTFYQGSPLGDLWLPLADGSLAEHDLDLTPEMLDLERLAGPPRQPGWLEIFGDLFCTLDPYGRVPWVEAILGSPIHATIQGGSMRTRAFVQSLEQWQEQPRHFDPAWFHTLLHLTEKLVERSAGRCAVTQPTLRGPADLAEAVLGPELMSFAMYDNPQALASFVAEASTVFITILHALVERVPKLAGGMVSPFGIWAPGSVVRTQCDATAFLSARQYEQWFLPQDVRICESVDYSIIHLHSVSLHTVEALLSVEKPMAIQITLEARPKGPELETMLPIFKKILHAKPLLLEGKLTHQEVAWLQANLPVGGLAISARETEW
jgi:hypothetical protein